MEQTLSLWFFSQSGTSALFDGTVIFFAKFFPYILVIGFFIFVLKYRDWKTRWLIISSAALSVILSRGVITETFSFFYFSPSPFEVLGTTPLFTVPGQSFPSGHATFFFALAISIFYFNKRLGWWYIALASINGVARVLAVVHWPSDIIGGAAVGILSALLIKELLKPYSEKILPTS